MCAREVAADYRNGLRAARIAAGYLLLILGCFAGAIALSVGGAGPEATSLAATLATLPGSALVVGALASAASRPDAAGTAGWAFHAAELVALLAVGVLQAWLLWRVGRGDRLP